MDYVQTIAFVGFVGLVVGLVLGALIGAIPWRVKR